ncbi:hypothetical protein BW866_004863 [Salmonella enterica subsp. enterica serovar Weltevreden]|nr:hypothetical protein [Salmonella enterica subsp. enterica serovar Weltevreden]
MEKNKLSEWANARIEQLNKTGTPFKVGQACNKCQERLYYVREGREHNGCIRCHDDNGATDKEHSHTSQGVTDANGEPVYSGRACKVCGSKTRYVNRPYGAKNKGACVQCVLAAIPEREHSKAINTLKVVVNKAMHSFLHSSVSRSGVVEVMPRNAAEWYALRSLVERVQLLNASERMLETGVRWEIHHVFPAGGVEDLRGVARIENLEVVESRLNKAMGDNVPEQWEPVQAIPIATLQRLSRSYEVSKALKQRKEALFPRMDKAEKAAYEQRQKEHERQHKALLAETLSHESHQLDLLLQGLEVPDFTDYLYDVETRLARLELKTSKHIEGLIAANAKEHSYTSIHGQTLLVSSFIGAHARLRVITQTLQRIEDAQADAEHTDNYNAEEWEALKRAAVCWAMDIANNPTVLITGFSHPLLSGSAGQVWGTVRGEDGKQYLCVWRDRYYSADSETPFDADQNWTPPNLLGEPTDNEQPEAVSVIVEGWQSTAERFIYEREQKRKTREADEARAALWEQTRQRVIFELKTLVDAAEVVIQAYTDNIPNTPINTDEWGAVASEAIRHYWNERATSKQRALTLTREAMNNALPQVSTIAALTRFEDEYTERLKRLVDSEPAPSVPEAGLMGFVVREYQRQTRTGEIEAPY